jgi:D-arabinose 1-dehydrogenase-like Zn-dependent alcohol dehydrogenase
MPKMRAVQVPRPGGPFEIVEREIPEASPGSVRIKVQACGICHSDSVVKDGLFPGIQYPRVPGHEVVGVVDAVGQGVARWKPGQRVGVGWHGGHCGYCDSCSRGDFFACQTSTLICGISFDGGYADYMIAPAEAIAAVPEELSVVEAAPLMCAGITTFNCLRNSGARAGDVVAVLEPSVSLEEKIRNRWQGNSAHTITSIVRARIPPRNYSSSAGLKSFWQQSPMPTR